MSYAVDVIRDGWTKPASNGMFSSGCTIVLLIGSKIVLIDPGSPWDTGFIISELSKRELSPEDIDFVIATHEHVDHVGSLNLFTTAVHIVGSTISCGKHKDCFNNVVTPFHIDDDVTLISTPGHTVSDISVLVRNTNAFGNAAIVGDLFECKDDIQNPSIWKSSSYDVELQEISRNKLLKMVDYIIPGHGKPFKVSL